MPIYLFVLLLILSIIYIIFEWKHYPYGKYKHELCFIKIDYIEFIQKNKNKNYIILNFRIYFLNKNLIKN